MKVHHESRTVGAISKTTTTYEGTPEELAAYQATRDNAKAMEKVWKAAGAAKYGDSNWRKGEESSTGRTPRDAPHIPAPSATARRLLIDLLMDSVSVFERPDRFGKTFCYGEPPAGTDTIAPPRAASQGWCADLHKDDSPFRVAGEFTSFFPEWPNRFAKKRSFLDDYVSAFARSPFMRGSFGPRPFTWDPASTQALDRHIRETLDSKTAMASATMRSAAAGDGAKEELTRRAGPPTPRSTTYKPAHAGQPTPADGDDHERDHVRLNVKEPKLRPAYERGVGEWALLYSTIKTFAREGAMVILYNHSAGREGTPLAKVNPRGINEEEATRIARRFMRAYFAAKGIDPASQ